MSEAANIAPALSGTERAAILLLSLGEEDAAPILTHMNPREVQKVGTAMASLNNVSRAMVTQVLQELVTTVDQQAALGVGSEETIRKMLVRALGSEKAKDAVDGILAGANPKGLDALRWKDARTVADTIRHEHPQMMALVLCYLEAEQGAEVLTHLPQSLRADLLMRIATLEGVQPGALDELQEILEGQLSGAGHGKAAPLGGLKIASGILNRIDSSAENAIMEEIGAADSALAQQIQDLMFVFEDLVSVNDKGIQTLLREVSTDALILALKGAEQSVKSKIFANMSKRAGETLREDLEARGPVRLSEVEAAQKEILAVVRRLAEAGELSMGGKGDDEYV